MNRHVIHNGDRSLFVDINPDRTVDISIGERAYGQFQKVLLSREDAADLAEWLLSETKPEAP